MKESQGKRHTKREEQVNKKDDLRLEPTGPSRRPHRLGQANNRSNTGTPRD